MYFVKMISKESLSDMKYSELQKLAKSYGIKANAKANVLIAAIEAYLLTQTNEPSTTSAVKSPEQSKAVESDEAKMSRVTPKQPAAAPVVSSTGKKASEKKAVPLSSGKTQSAAKKATTTSGGSRHQTPNNHITSRRGRKSIGGSNKSSAGGAGKKRNSKKTSREAQPVSSSSTAADVQQALNTTFDINEEELPTEPTGGRQSRRSTYELKEASVALPAVTPVAQSTAEVAAKTVETGSKRKRSAPKSDENKPVPGGAGNAKRAKMSAIPCRVAPSKPTLAEEANATKPITKAKAAKDWSKIHQKQFAKMEDIDDYLDRKTKRADVLRKPTAQPTPKPAAVSKVAPADTFQSPLVLSTKDINFAFGSMRPQTQAANKDVFAFQAATSAATGTGKKPTLNHRTSIAKKVATPANKTLAAAPTGNTTRKSVLTPFVTRNHNQSELNVTVGGSAKKRFDLQASLAKPITWKMHKGPLKPVGVEHGHCCPHPHPASAHCTDVKNVTIQSRDDRRQVARQSQAQRRHDNMAARRGMV